jgi:hypothetical protein
MDFQGVQPPSLDASAWGFLIGGERHEDGWLVLAEGVIEWRKGHPVGPVIKWAIPLDAQGMLCPPDDEGRGAAFAAWLPDFLPAAWTDAFVNQALAPLLIPAVFAVSLIHCRNVALRPVDPPERLSRKHERKHGQPLARYHVLDIAPMRRILDTEGEAQTRGLGHALHICRGHFKTFTEEAPLFGKRVGTYWWPAHVRGSSEEGVVVKDYRVRIDGEHIGQSYRVADEEVVVAPATVNADDPDTSERGLRAHNRVQNLLAEQVRDAGFSARSPKADEPTSISHGRRTRRSGSPK